MRPNGPLVSSPLSLYQFTLPENYGIIMEAIAKKNMKTLTIRNDAFVKIKGGYKTIEGRRKSKFIDKIEVGEILIFENSDTGEKLLIKILRISTYQKLNQMVSNEDMKKLTPYSFIQDSKDSVKHYTKIYKGKIFQEWIALEFVIITK